MSSVAPTSDARRPALLDRTLVSAFLENIPDYVYFKDRDSRYLALSRSLARYLGGQAARDIIGRTDADFLSPEHARSGHDEEQRIILTGQPVLRKIQRETRLGGQASWMLTNKLPLRNERGEIVGTFGLSKDVTETKEMELALEQAHRELVDASRTAGMAEVATGVLHNVSTVLNSLNVSASVIASGLRDSKARSLALLAARVQEHSAQLAGFLTEDSKGRQVPAFLASIARHARDERDHLLHEVAALQQHIDHIKEIVLMQQTYATMTGVVEPLDPATLMEDAVRMSSGALPRHDVPITREFERVPRVLGEKAKILQILVNVIRNAKYACAETHRPDQCVCLAIRTAPGGKGVQLVVRDNGIGIPPENLTRIFGHGFTTRTNGHGFGLHSAANAARQMRGSLTAHSAGRGEGASFTLELPSAPPPPAVP